MDLGIFGIIDIVVILFGIMFLFIGFKRGFMNKMIGLLGVLVMFALSLVLASNFAEFLKNRELIYPSIYDSIYEKMQAASIEAGEGASNADIIATALNIPNLFASFIAGKIEATPAELPALVAEKLGTYAMKGIAFLILAFAFTLVFIILKILANTLRQNAIIKTIDGLLGMALYLLIYVVIISLLFFILNILVTKEVITGSTLEFINTDLQLNTDAFRISKFLYNGNLFNSIKELFS